MPTDEHAQKKASQRFNDIKQLILYGAEYKMTENCIKCWVSLYGVLQGDLEEEAVLDEVVDLLTGTGAYLAMIRPTKRVPSLSPCTD
jgi:hypothetical protein